MSTLEQALNQKNDADIVRKGVVRFSATGKTIFSARRAETPISKL